MLKLEVGENYRQRKIMISSLKPLDSSDIKEMSLTQFLPFPSSHDDLLPIKRMMIIRGISPKIRAFKLDMKVK
jgi:hypothetical protein